MTYNEHGPDGQIHDITLGQKANTKPRPDADSERREQLAGGIAWAAFASLGAGTIAEAGYLTWATIEPIFSGTSRGVIDALSRLQHGDINSAIGIAFVGSTVVAGCIFESAKAFKQAARLKAHPVELRDAYDDPVTEVRQAPADNHGSIIVGSYAKDDVYEPYEQGYRGGTTQDLSESIAPAADRAKLGDTDNLTALAYDDRQPTTSYVMGYRGLQDI